MSGHFCFRKSLPMPVSSARVLVDYTPSCSSATMAADPGPTTPQSAVSASAAALVTVPSTKAKVPTHQQGDGTTSSATAKRSVVRRTRGERTTLQAWRADAAWSSGLSGYFATRCERKPRSIAATSRTAGTVDESMGKSALLSVVRNRAAVMGNHTENSIVQPAFSATSHRERYWTNATAQGSVSRRHELSLSPTATCSASKEHCGRNLAQMELAAFSARNIHTTRAVSEPATPPPFELLSARRPVPELPTKLKWAITSYYLSCLRRLSVAHQERVVHAIALKKDCKTVITCLKQPAAPSPSSIMGRLAKGRHQTGTAHLVPKNAPRSTLNEKRHRRLIREYNASFWKQQGTNAEESQAINRFCQRFAVEACAAFLDSAIDMCIARRTRFYQQQPLLATKHGVVLPEEQLIPLYIAAVDDLLYNMTGWTQREAQKFSRVVVTIVRRGIPSVVSSPAAEKAVAAKKCPHMPLTGTPALPPSSLGTDNSLISSYPTTAETAAASVQDMNHQRVDPLLSVSL
ncbi:hypothetical protein, conserved [Leishmania tarentolae]|uniref:Uncharacterized protein n=1 Tax=Leishmania tarentolae TaxID=5689 RepID=A0A640KD50_LEITA|nr:hypothetical protein, conserved [Leishmania tarentolae]